MLLKNASESTRSVVCMQTQKKIFENTVHSSALQNYSPQRSSAASARKKRRRWGDSYPVSCAASDWLSACLISLLAVRSVLFMSSSLSVLAQWTLVLRILWRTGNHTYFWAFSKCVNQRTGGKHRLQPAACILFHSSIAPSLSKRRRDCGMG